MLESAAQLCTHVCRLGLFLVAAYGAGRFYPRYGWRELPWFKRNLLALINGLGWLGFLALLAGLIRLLTPTVMKVILGSSLVYGIYRLRSELRGLSSKSFVWNRLPRLYFGLIALSILAGLNVILGALAPDAAQDSLWYHLACARAWLWWHAPYAWPTVYPSAHTTHASLLYAFCLSWGDEIDCSLLYAATGFFTFAIAAHYASEWYGSRAAVWTWFLCATAYATYVWFVPINTGNDLTAAMFATAGILGTISFLTRCPSNNIRRIELRFAALALGWGSVTKLTVAGYALLPVWMLLVLVYLAKLWRNGHGKTNIAGHNIVCIGMKELFGFLALSLFPFFLWSLRNLSYGSGSPFFPMFRDLLPVKPEFEIVRRNMAINTLYPLSLHGGLSALASLPSKLQYAAMARSPGFLLHAAVVFTSLIFGRRDPRYRLAGILCAMQWVVYIWSVGFNETIKYFAVIFAPAFVFLSPLFVKFEDLASISRELRQLSLGAVAVLLAGIYAMRQWEWSNFETVAWGYRPILSHDDRLRYLCTKPYQLVNIYLYDYVNKTLPKDATVLFPDNAYPFYVNRRYLWCDEDLDFFSYLADLGVTSSEDVALYLSDHKVTHVIASPENIKKHPEWECFLEEEQVGVPHARARLYRIRPATWGSSISRR